MQQAKQAKPVMGEKGPVRLAGGLATVHEWGNLDPWSTRAKTTPRFSHR